MCAPTRDQTPWLLQLSYNCALLLLPAAAGGAAAGGGLRDSFLVDGVAFKKTFSYAGFEQQPKSFNSERLAAVVAADDASGCSSISASAQ